MKSDSRSRIWAFVSDNIIALSTVVAGVGVIIWQAIAAPSNLDPTSAAILALLCLLATSEIIESRKRLDRIQETIDEQIPKILAVLPTSRIRRFPDSESGTTYLYKRLEDAKTSIDFASVDVVSRATAEQARNKLVETRIKIAASGTVRFRYLFRANTGRIARVKDMLKGAVAGKFFTACLPRDAGNLPVMSFIIFDNEEVFTRNPYEVGEEEIYVAIENPDVAGLFSKWFDRLWNLSVKIDPKLYYEQQAAELDHLLN